MNCPVQLTYGDCPVCTDTPPPVQFTVFGDPQPKGSTRAFARVVRGQMRAITTSANPNLESWEQRVGHEAQRLARETVGGVFFDGAIEIRVVFGFIRPASVTIKKRPHHTVKPDLDKLARGCIDPMSKVLFNDDAQVVSLTVRKCYVAAGPAYAAITVSAYR